MVDGAVGTLDEQVSRKVRQRGGTCEGLVSSCMRVRKGEDANKVSQRTDEERTVAG